MCVSVKAPSPPPAPEPIPQQSPQVSNATTKQVKLRKHRRGFETLCIKLGSKPLILYVRRSATNRSSRDSRVKCHTIKSMRYQLACSNV